MNVSDLIYDWNRLPQSMLSVGPVLLNDETLRDGLQSPSVRDEFITQTTAKADKYAVSLGLEVMYVTEDTTRCDPEMVKRLYSTAINCGACAIVLCDTAGHATPMGTLALVKFVMEEIVKP